METRDVMHVLRARNGESNSSMQNMQVTFHWYKIYWENHKYFEHAMQVKFKLIFSTKFTGKSKYIDILFQKRYWKNGNIFSKIRLLHDIILSYMWENFILKWNLRGWQTLHFFLDIWMRDDALALWIIISKIILFLENLGSKGPRVLNYYMS